MNKFIETIKKVKRNPLLRGEAITVFMDNSGDAYYIDGSKVDLNETISLN